MNRLRAPAALYLISLGWLAAVALRHPLPFDWDSAAAAALARRILAGEGATTAALWQLLVQTGALPMPADLHWMPLPSRVLLPGLWLHPAGDRITSALLGAALAPLAWAWAALLSDQARAAGRPLPAWIPAAAGLWAATGGASARFLVLPDSVAPFGLAAGLCLLLAAQGRHAAALLPAAAAALCRNDGFLIGICATLGLLLTPRPARPAPLPALLPALLPAAAGLLAWIGWQFRCAALVPGWWEIRAQLPDVLDLTWMIDGHLPPVTAADRLAALARRLPPAALIVGLVALPLWAWPGLYRYGRLPALRGVACYLLIWPVAGCLLAPGIFLEGSFFRSSAAVFPVGCALAAAALHDLARRAPRLHPWFVAAAAALPALALQLAAGGALRERPPPLTPAGCAGIADLPPGPVLSDHPPLVELFCDRPAVILPRALSADEVAALAARYGVTGALITGGGPGGTVEPDRQLPGWIAVPASAGTAWRRP